MGIDEETIRSIVDTIKSNPKTTCDDTIGVYQSANMRLQSNGTIVRCILILRSDNYSTIQPHRIYSVYQLLHICPVFILEALLASESTSHLKYC